MAAHIDISPEALTDLLKDNSEHHFRVDQGVPEDAKVDDVTYIWNGVYGMIRLHFDREVPNGTILTNLGCRNLLSSRGLIRMVAGDQ